MYRAAIIGCGKIAGGYDKEVPTEWSLTHAGAYHLCPETRIVAVSDPNLSVLNTFKKKWNIERGYLDFLEMLKNETIDILSLCLPTKYHYDAFKAAIDHNIKAIYCEKPLADTFAHAHKMVEMAQRRVVAVNYFRRWNPNLTELYREISEGDFGRALHAVVRYTKGILLNGSHFVDLMRWFWGNPENINFIKTSYDAPLDPGIDFSLTFKNGMTAYFTNIPEVNYVFAEIDILMEKGRIVIGQRGQKLFRYPVIQDPHYLLFDIIGDPVEIETAWRNCTTRAITEILNCLKNGGTTSCTVEDGYHALKICRQILKLKNSTTD